MWVNGSTGWAACSLFLQPRRCGSFVFVLEHLWVVELRGGVPAPHLSSRF